MHEVIGKEIYPFLESIISHENYIVIPGLNKNHELTQEWLKIAFMKKKKTKNELDELLYQWGDLKRTYESKLTQRYQNKTYITKEKKEERAKKSGLKYDKNGKLIDFNPYMNDLDIVAMNSDDEKEDKRPAYMKKSPETKEEDDQKTAFLSQFIAKNKN